MVDVNTQQAQIPIPQDALPATQAVQAEPGVSEDGAIGFVKKDHNEKSLSKFARAGISIAELIAATPLVVSSLLNQADNIAKYGASDEGTVGFFASIIETLSLPFRVLINKFIVKTASIDGDDVKANKRPFLFDDIYQRLLHPNIAKEFTSALFTFRRVIFNFFPNVFTVPSEEHNPDASEGKIASGSVTSFFSALSTFTSPMRFFSSLVGLVTLAPAKLMSAYYAFTGNQKLYETSKDFADIVEPLNPIIANLSSTYSTAKAYMDSFKKGESTLVTFGKYNITSLNLIQGVFGSILSIAQFFGALAKIKNKLAEKDGNQKLKFVSLIRDFVGEIAPRVKSLGYFSNQTVAGMQDKVENFMTKLMVTSADRLSNYTHNIFNATPILQKIFGKIRPKNLAGNVIANTAVNSIEPNEAAEKYFAGTLRKSTFFTEIFDLLQPVQSMLMLLPNALVPVGDPYITDNAIRPLRVFDRLLGINSVLLSVPNYIVYSLSTRVPQMVLKYFEIKQRKAELKAAEGDLSYKNYDAFGDYKAFVGRVGKMSIFGSSFLEKVLSKLEINRDVFKDAEVMDKAYQELETTAKDQESSVKSSELVSAIRIGIRTLLNHNMFKTERDKDTGLTAEEKSRQKIYNSLGTFKEGVGRIPVLGWIAGSFIEMFRGMYKVDVNKNRKQLPGIRSAQAASVNPAAPAANPLTALMKGLGGINPQAAA